ncbi:glycoside hydrolase family 15 protein [Lysinimonas soli]|uniref:Glycoside hydrolase family 15 protein n=1 Tax=Lysinimonas soli TaxID=1074233 RepID=A0ABW0NND6_9MICO
MPLAIEDYAVIGDCHTAALVGMDGSIDWLCLPRFDSASAFAALLGDEEQGHWRIAPLGAALATSRAYHDDTFVLATRWVTDDGEVEVVDLMPRGDRRADVVRRVRGVRGSVQMEQVLRIRFDYASAVPWIRQAPEHDGPGPDSHALLAVAGPDSVVVRGPKLEADGMVHRSRFTVSAGETVDVVLTWYPSHREPPAPIDVNDRIRATEAWWRGWAKSIEASGPYSEQVRRSLLMLRALTHEETGGIVAAATTSLPEAFGGARNWDYRYVWLRDASLTLQALLEHGFDNEAHAWRNWLLRAIAGDPADVQIMYGVAGERRLPEWELDSLPGYRGASPVRVGNGAVLQFQGDIFGEVMLALQQTRESGIVEDRFSWSLQLALLDRAEQVLDRDDHGIWEIRGPEHRFTHSRAMIWAAFDCGIRAVHEHGLDGPVDRWIAVRDQLRNEIESNGFDPALNSFVQYYGSTAIDASLLALPQIGFVAADDPRMLGTVAAIERGLIRDGLVMRYEVSTGVDGLVGDEHPFLACSFWLAQQYAASGRLDDAVALMDRLVGLCNDVGMLSEEYDVDDRRHVGNTPQALSHLTLVRAADAIERARNATSG